MRWWAIINPKYYNISSKVIIETPLTFSIKDYSVATIHIPLLVIMFCCISRSKQTIFNVKILSGIFGQLSKSDIYNFRCVIVLFYNRRSIINCIPILFLKYFMLCKKPSLYTILLDLLISNQYIFSTHFYY